MAEREATEATIKLIYGSYYGEMGGAGVPPELPAQSSSSATDNVTAFKRPPAPWPKTGTGIGAFAPASGGADLLLPHVIYVGIRYFL